MSDINWEDAPEGATHYGITTGNFYKETDEMFAYFTTDWLIDNYAQPHRSMLIEKVDKPIYTAAMCEANKLPLVGMECLVKRFHADDSHLIGGYIIGHSQDKCWLVFETEDDSLLYHNIKNGTFVFKPLTPPIELICGKVYTFYYDNNKEFLCGFYNSKLKAFECEVNNKPVNNCINIQLLEVKS